MLKNVYFISMEGKTNFHIGDFKVREDIALPVLIENSSEIKPEEAITTNSVINGLMKVIAENDENENFDYYKDMLLVLKPNIEKEFTELSFDAIHNKHFESALDFLKVLIALYPYSLEVNLNMAICYDEYSQYYYSIGQVQKADKLEDFAYEYYKVVENHENKTEQAIYHLGIFFLTRENYEKALDYFSSFIKITKNQELKNSVMEVINEIGTNGVNDEDYQQAMAFIESDMHEQALGYLQRFITKFPQSWSGYYLNGIALRNTQDYERAIRAQEKALALNDSFYDIYNELGLNYMNLNNYSKSELNFSRAIKLHPDDISIMTNLAMLSYKRGNKEEAIKYCEIILDEHPDDQYTKDLQMLIVEDKL